MNNACCVVIPVHSTKMAIYQYASIIQIIKTLNAFDLYVVHPENLDIALFNKLHINNVAFDDCYFKSWGSYNRLCMSNCFYEAFKQYDYMLIAQTDTWIFRDELQYWCDKGYDYIGAPLCHYCKNVDNCNYIEDPVDVIIGNGGLSLRRIQKFIDATKYINDNKLLDSYTIDDTPAEDWFLMRINELHWKVPKCSEAVKFSIEGHALKHTVSGIMPFGYHNLVKIQPQAAFLLHFNNNIKNNIDILNNLIASE